MEVEKKFAKSDRVRGVDRQNRVKRFDRAWYQGAIQGVEGRT